MNEMNDVDDFENKGDMESLQRLINSGTIWKFQGSMGRAAMAALEAGDVMLGIHPRLDYYMNAIPSRDQVKPGSKGSYLLVVDANGREYADQLRAL